MAGGGVVVAFGDGGVFFDEGDVLGGIERGFDQCTVSLAAEHLVADDFGEFGDAGAFAGGGGEGVGEDVALEGEFIFAAVLGFEGVDFLLSTSSVGMSPQPMSVRTPTTVLSCCWAWGCETSRTSRSMSAWVASSRVALKEATRWCGKSPHEADGVGDQLAPVGFAQAQQLRVLVSRVAKSLSSTKVLSPVRVLNMVDLPALV